MDALTPVLTYCDNMYVNSLAITLGKLVQSNVIQDNTSVRNVVVIRVVKLPVSVYGGSIQW